MKILLYLSLSGRKCSDPTCLNRRNGALWRRECCRSALSGPVRSSLVDPHSVVLYLSLTLCPRDSRQHECRFQPDAFSTFISLTSSARQADRQMGGFQATGTKSLLRPLDHHVRYKSRISVRISVSRPRAAARRRRLTRHYSTATGTVAVRFSPCTRARGRASPGAMERGTRTMTRSAPGTV